MRLSPPRLRAERGLVCSRAGDSDRHLDLGHRADRGRDDALLAHPARGEDDQRPVAGRGEEAEAAVLAEGHLGDELVTAAAQPCVALARRHAADGDVALDDGLLASGVPRAGEPARGRSAAFVAQRASPTSIGTPPTNPYSFP